MADNTVLNTGAGGDTIATDDVAGVKYQRVKLMDGTADSTAVIPGDATNGLDVDVTRVQGTVTVDTELNLFDHDTGAGTDNQPAIGLLRKESGGAVLVGSSNPLPVSISAQGTDGAVGIGSSLVLIGGYDGTNQQTITTDASGRLVIVDGGGSVTVDGTVTANAGTGPFPVSDNAGSLTVDAPVGTPAFVRLSDGSAAITALPITDNSGSLTIDGNVGTLPLTSGGLTPSMTISAASTNATSVKGSAGQLYTVFASNINAAVRYLKIFNKATAPTVGTDVPVLVFAIPGNTAGAGLALDSTHGFALGTGLAFAITTGVATADTGAVAANELVINLGYK